MTDPAQVIQQLQQQSTLFEELASVRLVVEDEIQDELGAEINYTALTLLLKTAPNRDKCAVVVVDYAMPAMYGVEFCQRLSELPCKKVMLTGEGRLEVAVEAFNQGIIDQFIPKDVISMADKLHEAIEHLQQSYFLDFSRRVTIDALGLLALGSFKEVLFEWIEQ